MHRTAQFVLASLFTLVMSSVSQAGIVLTAVQTSAVTSQNVSVNLYATWDGVTTPTLSPAQSANVGAYRFRVTIAGTTVTGLTASHNLNLSSVWSGIQPLLAIPGSPSISGQQIEFSAANTGSPSSAIPNVTVGSVIGASTLLGTINFNTTPAFFQMTYTALATQDYSPVVGFGFVPTNNVGNQTPHLFVAPPSNLVVVPEPGTFALCGLAGLVGVWRARRKK